MRMVSSSAAVAIYSQSGLKAVEMMSGESHMNGRLVQSPDATSQMHALVSPTPVRITSPLGLKMAEEMTQQYKNGDSFYRG